MVTSRRTAKDIMTTPVHTVRPSDPLAKVIGLICRHRISGIPVVNGKERLVGIISERDIVQALYSVNGSQPGKKTGHQVRAGLRDLSEVRAGDIMVTQVVTANRDTDFLRLASIMALQKIRRIPIVEGMILVGIVSHGDVGRAIFGNTGESEVCPALHTEEDAASGSGS